MVPVLGSIFANLHVRFVAERSSWNLVGRLGPSTVIACAIKRESKNEFVD